MHNDRNGSGVHSLNPRHSRLQSGRQPNLRIARRAKLFYQPCQPRPARHWPDQRWVARVAGCFDELALQAPCSKSCLWVGAESHLNPSSLRSTTMSCGASIPTRTVEPLMPRIETQTSLPILIDCVVFLDSTSIGLPFSCPFGNCFQLERDTSKCFLACQDFSSKLPLLPLSFKF